MGESKREQSMGTITSLVEDCNATTSCSSPCKAPAIAFSSFSSTRTLRNDKMAPAACNLAMLEKCSLCIACVSWVTAEITEGGVPVGAEEAATLPNGSDETSETLSSNRECNALKAFVAASRMDSPSFFSISFSFPPSSFFGINCMESLARGRTDSNCGKALAPNLRKARGQFSINPARVSRVRDRRDHCSFRDSHSLSFSVMALFPFFPLVLVLLLFLAFTI
mmetsp:Transcript_5480/g.9960  ORF Transcript_5480/g.9960 Transcript_5480/m.9960 type:complete len:223 (-) Transcript_5480:585-1253(-)